MPVDDRWSKLSMRDRADLIKIYTKHGVTDLNEIRRHYNSFNDDSTSYNNTKADGGHLFQYGGDDNTIYSMNPSLLKRLEEYAESYPVEPYTAELTTYPFFNKQYIPSHSKLKAYRVNDKPYSTSEHGRKFVKVSKYFDDNGYNLLFNNCADATGNALGFDTGFITTPFEIRKKVRDAFDVTTQKLKNGITVDKFPITYGQFKKIQNERLKQDLLNDGWSQGEAEKAVVDDMFSFSNGGHLYQGHSEPTQQMRTLYDEASDQIYGMLPEINISTKAPKGYRGYPMAFEKEFNDNGGIYGGFRNKDRAYQEWQTTQKYFSPENLDKYRLKGFKPFTPLVAGSMAAPAVVSAGIALAPIVAESAPIVSGYATKFGLPLAASIPSMAIYNFAKNRQFAKNYVFDDVIDNLLEREGRDDFGVYAHSKYRRGDYKPSIASKYTPENNQPVLDLSLNPVKYFHNGKNPLKMPLKKILKDIRANGNNAAYNSANVVRVNPVSWFFLTPTKFKGLLGHEGQHSVQKTLDSDFALATSGKGYYINNPYSFYTREVLKPFERHDGKWIGSPNELDSEIINWKIQNNIPLSTDFINMDDGLQKKFVNLTKKRFKLKEDEAFNILHSLSKLGYFQNGGQLGRITPYGQWQYPHQITTIPSNNITMQGVDYPVMGISDTGDKKLMLPGLDYIYDGNYVTEYPVNTYQFGGEIFNPDSFWSSLSPREKAQIIGNYNEHGITHNIRNIKNIINKEYEVSHTPIVKKPNEWLSRNIMGDVQYLYEDRFNSDNPVQDSYLLNRKDQEEYLLRNGLIKGKDEDYGLVNKAARKLNKRKSNPLHKETIPVYQTAEDMIDRDRLAVIKSGDRRDLLFYPGGDPYSMMKNTNALMYDPGEFPMALYVDRYKPSDFYIKAWDLNDYTPDSDYWHERIGGRMLDFIGSPIVQTTGYQKVNNEVTEAIKKDYLDPWLKSKGLHREVLDDGEEIIAMKPVTITAKKNKK